MDLSLCDSDAPRPENGPFVPYNLIPGQRSPVPMLKFQMAPSLKLLIASGSKKKEPSYIYIYTHTHTHTHTYIHTYIYRVIHDLWTLLQEVIS